MAHGWYRCATAYMQRSEDSCVESGFLPTLTDANSGCQAHLANASSLVHRWPHILLVKTGSCCVVQADPPPTASPVHVSPYSSSLAEVL